MDGNQRPVALGVHLLQAFRPQVPRTRAGSGGHLLDELLHLSRFSFRQELLYLGLELFAAQASAGLLLA